MNLKYMKVSLFEMLQEKNNFYTTFIEMHLYIYFYYHKKNIIIIAPYEIRFISKFSFFQFYLYQILFSIIFWIPF